MVLQLDNSESLNTAGRGDLNASLGARRNDGFARLQAKKLEARPVADCRGEGKKLILEHLSGLSLEKGRGGPGEQIGGEEEGDGDGGRLRELRPRGGSGGGEDLGHLKGVVRRCPRFLSQGYKYGVTMFRATSTSHPSGTRGGGAARRRCMQVVVDGRRQLTQQQDDALALH